MAGVTGLELRYPVASYALEMLRLPRHRCCTSGSVAARAPRRSAGKAAITPPGRLAPATLGHGECGLLVRLQSELLGQHDIPKRKVPYRTEAPDGDSGASRTDLV